MLKLMNAVRRAEEIVRLWPSVIVLLCAVSVVTAAAAQAAWVTVVCVLIPLGIITYRQRRTIFAVPRGAGGLRRYAVARFLLLVAAGLGNGDAHGWGPVWILVVAGATVLLESERIVKILNSFAESFAENVDTVSRKLDWVIRPGLLYQFNIAFLFVLAIGPLLPGWIRWVYLVLVVGALVAVGILGMQGVHRVRARHRFQRTIRDTLHDVSPVFYLYWHAPAGSSFQVAMWLPYLERLGVPFVVVVRTITNLREAAALTARPVILRRGMDELDDLIVPSAKAVFYVNGAIRNLHMARYTEFRHIQLNHGESDKAPSVNPTIRLYDLNFVAGQAAIDRFESKGIEMPASMFRVVGRPQVENVEGSRGPISGIRVPTVLYAPTWRGYHADAHYSSLPWGVEIVRGLLARGCTVIFRPHPYSYHDKEFKRVCVAIKKLLRNDSRVTGRSHLWGQEAESSMSITDCFNGSDAMVSDVSSVVGDYLFSAKPFAMISTRGSADEFTTEFPMARASYVVETGSAGLKNLDGILGRMLGADPHASTRRTLASYYLGNFSRESYAERFVSTARQELGSRQPATEMSAT